MDKQKEHIKSLLLHFFNGTANTSEKDELMNWMHQSKENMDYSVLYYKKWSESMIFDYHFGKEQGWQRFTNAIESHKRRKLTIYHHFAFYGTAAIILLLIGIAFYLKINMPEKSDITQFANVFSNQINMHSSDVKLVLSADSMLTFNTKAANIQYKSGQIVCSNGLSVVDNEEVSYHQLIVPFGHSSKLTLSDGTHIWVNSGTRLIYPSTFKEKNREIYVDGEIYLEVARDVVHPFIVKTPQNMNVRVLGTHFDVKACKGESVQRVVLLSGAVQVSQNTICARLSPDDMYELRDGKASVRRVDPSYYVSWIKGQYIVDGEKLDEIFGNLIKYYGVNIEFGPSVAPLCCSGKLDLHNTFDNVLKSISETAPITYKKQNGTYYINLK